MPTLAQRLAAKTEDTGAHHIWKGAKDERGNGLVSVGGRITTVRRVVWELANGELPANAKVLACPADAACVKLEHLSVSGSATRSAGTRRTRARKGAGSMRRLRPGVWELRVTVGRWSDGRPRTQYRTANADGEARSRKGEILAEIAKLDFCLPGSLVERTTRCGTPTCGCHNNPDRRHGPYPSWIRKVGAKTVTHTLSATQTERYRAWFDSTRRLRALVDELQALSVQVINDAEGWEQTTTATA